jgi:hypothetical protein
MDVPACRLCGAVLPEVLPEEGGLRCPNCGLHQATELGRSGVQRLAIGLVGVYVLTALLVLLTRG